MSEPASSAARPTDSELGRLEAIEGRLDKIEAAQRENTAATLEGNRDAREILEIFQAVRGGFKVLGWIGAAARWVAVIGGALGGAYAAWHSATGGNGKP